MIATGEFLIYRFLSTYRANKDESTVESLILKGVSKVVFPKLEAIANPKEAVCETSVICKSVWYSDKGP